MNSNMSRPMTLAELIQQMVTKHPEGAMGAAELLGMEQNSIYAMLSTSEIKTSKAKLGVFQWLSLLQWSKDFRSLHKFCEMVDHICIPIPHGGLDHKQLLEHAARVTKEVNEAVSTLLEAMSATSEGGEAISSEEQMRICTESYEGLQALTGLYVAMKR